MSDITIPVFDGVDYVNWKKRITMYLKLKKCDMVIVKNEPAETEMLSWEENNLKATNYIYSAITNKQLEYVSDKETAHDIIKKFDELYLKESTALQIVCRNRLEKMRLQEYSDTATFFNEFEKAVNELKGAGAKVTEKEKKDYMLRMLPEQMSHIGDLIDVLKEEDQTVEYIKSKITMMNIREKNRGDDNLKLKTNVFIADKENSRRKQDLRCYSCGKLGHVRRACKSELSRNTWTRGGYHRGNNRGKFIQRGGYRNHGESQRSQDEHRGSYSNWSRGRSEYQRTRGSRFEGDRDNQQYGSSMNSFTMETQSERICNNVELGNIKIKIDWLLDSGCTDHIINNDKYFSECVVLREPVNVKIGDGKFLKASKVGQVISYFSVYDKMVPIKLRNVFFVEKMNRNLISYAKVTDENRIVSTRENAKIFDQENKLIAIAWKVDRLYKMTSYVYSNEVGVNMSEYKKNMSNKEKWHRILGHVNFKYLDVLCKDKLIEGIPDRVENEYMKCKTCIENKMCNLPFENKRSRAREILEIVHTDLNGPHSVVGNNGERYFISFIDDYSKLARVYAIRSKDQVYDCFVGYINEVENLTGKRIKRLRCDNGKEYLNNRLFQLAREKGIMLNNCPAYVHELNGTAERFNRSIMDMARCLLAEAKVSTRFWPEVVCTAAYLKNRTLANTIERKTPYEIVFGKKPDAKYLRLYGSRVFVRVPEELRKSKWDRKADLGILLGYTEVGYKVLINNRVIVARHVDIIEENTKCIGMSENDRDSEWSECEEESVTKDVSMRDSKSMIHRKDTSERDTNELVPETSLRRSNRENKMPSRFDDSYVYNNIIYVNVCSADSPGNFEEAVRSSESEQWMNAMKKEIECLHKNDTWKLVKKPENKLAIDVKWVYTRKSDNRYKARLVVRGFQQKDVIEDIYSPVAKMQTLKVLLSYCCQEGLIIEQMDVETAFLNGFVVSEVYVKQPPGFEDGTDRVCMLYKALYGLRESPRAWYECLDEYLISIGFVKSKFDYCMYVLKNGSDVIYLIVFVDDLLICCKRKERIKEIKSLLSKNFKMKDLGEVKNYLGININYDYENNTMSLDQEAYIESLARKYNIEQSKLYNTPMETNLRLELVQNVSQDVKYRNLIGALLYISSGTRPDISYSVNYLSRFQNGYSNTHFKYALRVLKYLYLTKDLKLKYERNEMSDILDCFVDADWAGDSVDRKSTTGYVIRLFGNVIFWKSKKQGTVTKSSTFAEYVALSDSVTEIKLILDILSIFEIKVEEPVKIYEDNSGAVNIARYGNFTKNSKYIEVHYHFVNEYYMNKIINICKVKSEDNIADIFTKSLSKDKFVRFREMLNVT